MLQVAAVQRQQGGHTGTGTTIVMGEDPGFFPEISNVFKTVSPCMYIYTYICVCMCIYIYLCMKKRSFFGLCSLATALQKQVGSHSFPSPLLGTFFFK